MKKDDSNPSRLTIDELDRVYGGSRQTFGNTLSTKIVQSAGLVVSGSSTIGSL
jgi:hypothetical protein